MCAGGPPNPVEPIRSNSFAIVPRETPTASPRLGAAAEAVPESLRDHRRRARQRRWVCGHLARQLGPLARRTRLALHRGGDRQVGLHPYPPAPPRPLLGGIEAEPAR